jgi:pectate lyase
MRTILLALFLRLWGQALPAFPGAEGFGADTPGGRGGRILLVTSLGDQGPGSLREAVRTKGPRMILFAVAGIIDLQSELVIQEPYVTIAGQSAPGDGVCLRGHGLRVNTHDVVIRYLRVRPGEASGKAIDALSIGGESHHVIVDHVSASWAIDEVLSPSGAVRDITVQWSIIAEALNSSLHPKGEHGYGSLVRATGGVSLHHNLWAHNSARNPRLGDNYGRPPFPVFDVRNNVIYNYGAMCSGMTGDRLDANYIGNYIRPGPSSNTKRAEIVFTDTAEARFHVRGNVVEGKPGTTADNLRLFDRPQRPGRRVVTPSPEPFTTPAVSTQAAAEAFEAVLRIAGANLPVRDAVDTRIIGHVREQKGRIINTTADAGGWPTYRPGRPGPDADRDGLPDEWERAHGLNPHDPRDASADRDGDGYTNLEEFLNDLTVIKSSK